MHSDSIGIIILEFLFLLIIYLQVIFTFDWVGYFDYIQQTNKQQMKLLF